MVHAALQNALPLLVFFGEMLLAERPQNSNRERPIMMPFDRILEQAAEAQQSGSGDGRGGSIQQTPGFGRRVKVPGRNAIAVAVRDVVIGAGLGRLEKPRIAAVFVGKAEAVKRPCQTARPAGVAAVTLLRALPQKFPGLQIENPFLRRGSIAPYQIAPGSEAVA